MSTCKRADRDPREERLTTCERSSAGSRQQVDEHADGDDERRRRTSAVASQPASGLAEAPAERRAGSAKPEQRQRRDQPDDVEHGRLSPSVSEMSSAVAPGLRRRMATMMPRPTTTSAAATTSTKNTDGLPADVVEHAGEGDEGEVDRVEHELDAHEHDERVAPDEHADGADARTARRRARRYQVGVGAATATHLARRHSGRRLVVAGRLATRLVAVGRRASTTVPTHGDRSSSTDVISKAKT